MYSCASSRGTLVKGGYTHSPSSEVIASSAAFLVRILSGPAHMIMLVSAQGLSFSNIIYCPSKMEFTSVCVRSSSMIIPVYSASGPPMMMRFLSRTDSGTTVLSSITHSGRNLLKSTEKSLQNDASVSLERITVFSGVSSSFPVDTGTHKREESKITKKKIFCILINSKSFVDSKGLITFPYLVSFI